MTENVEIIEEEDPSEEIMEINDIAAEPLNSTRVNRCGHCRRMQFGHPVPYGSEKCLLDKIKDDEDLKKDDEIKLDMRKKKRCRKRSLNDSKLEPGRKRDKKVQAEYVDQ